MCDIPFTSLETMQPTAKCERNLLSIPDELLEMVLLNLSYDEISRVRLVCRRFDTCCQRLLNRGFLQVEKFHSQCLRDIKAQLPRRESERRDHPLARHSDILTAIETRLSLLSMTFIKYVDMNLCCFIPGKVIDEIFRVLRYVQCTSTPPRSHEILQELRDISSMAMEHFDENIVPLLKHKMGATARTVSLVTSPVIGSTPGRPSPTGTSCVGGTVRRELAKLQMWVRHLTTSTNCIKKELVDYKEKVTEYKKKLQEQDKRILEQDQIIAEQCVRISEQEGKISEMNSQVLECNRRVAELGRYGEETIVKRGNEIVSKPVVSSPMHTVDGSIPTMHVVGDMSIVGENCHLTRKTQGKRNLSGNDWSCCKRQKSNDSL